MLLKLIGCITAPSTCAPKEFSCNDTGRCIPGSYTCDGDQDCADGSDESDKLCQESLSSQKSACSEAYQFTCDNKICIAKSWECDGYPDCSDKSDEHDQCKYWYKQLRKTGRILIM